MNNAKDSARVAISDAWEEIIAGFFKTIIKERSEKLDFRVIALGRFNAEFSTDIVLLCRTKDCPKEWAYCILTDCSILTIPDGVDVIELESIGVAKYRAVKEIFPGLLPATGSGISLGFRGALTLPLGWLTNDIHEINKPIRKLISYLCGNIIQEVPGVNNYPWHQPIGVKDNAVTSEV